MAVRTLKEDTSGAREGRAWGMAVDLTPDRTEELLQAIVPHLPPPKPRSPKGGRPPKDDLACLRGILYLLREGCKWQKIPCQQLGCPSGSTCWRRFRDWT